MFSDEPGQHVTEMTQQVIQIDHLQAHDLPSAKGEQLLGKL